MPKDPCAFPSFLKILLSSMPHLVILSSNNLSEHHPDDIALKKELFEEGLDAEIANWEDFQWQKTSCDSVIFRSAWGYYRHLKEFRKFLKNLTPFPGLIWNPLKLVRWNLNKKYLLELAKKGCSILPTKVFQAHEFIDIQATQENLEAESLVVKPAIGANASNTQYIALGDKLEEAYQHIDSIRDQEILIQPYLKQIHDEGEYSLIFIEGVLSHSVLKIPKEGDFRVQASYGGTAHRTATPSGALKVAQRVLSSLHEEPLYARIDLVRTTENHFLVMEVELIEPDLFLRLEPQAAKRLAAAISKRL